MGSRKVVLVTGANRGIGFEVVRQLASDGFEVILTARDMQKGISAQQHLKNENLHVDFVPMDILSSESIRQASSIIKENHGKLDALINNAAILMRQDRSLLKDDPEILNQTIEANAIAQLRVTQVFYSLIVPGGKVIMTSSNGGSMTDPVGGWSPAYCVSKTLLNAITRHLSFELMNRNISVNAYDPGWVNTDMGGPSAPGTILQGADTAVWLVNSENISTGKLYCARKEIPW